jgi:hypothetical protein
MDLPKIMNSTVGQFFVSAISPKGSATASNSALASSSTQQIEGHHHHHRKSMTDRVTEMQVSIDSALKSGKITDDQATQMKQKLDAIAQSLNTTQNTIQAATSNQLTSADLQKIKSQYQDVRKQFYDALHPQTATLQSVAMNSLFKKMDANGDGSLNQSELASFISALV